MKKAGKDICNQSKTQREAHLTSDKHNRAMDRTNNPSIGGGAAYKESTVKEEKRTERGKKNLNQQEKGRPRRQASKAGRLNRMARTSSKSNSNGPKRGTCGAKSKAATVMGKRKKEKKSKGEHMLFQ